MKVTMTLQGLRDKESATIESKEFAEQDKREFLEANQKTFWTLLKTAGFDSQNLTVSSTTKARSGITIQFYQVPRENFDKMKKATEAAVRALGDKLIGILDKTLQVFCAENYGSSLGYRYLDSGVGKTAILLDKMSVKSTENLMNRTVADLHCATKNLMHIQTTVVHELGHV